MSGTTPVTVGTTTVWVNVKSQTATAVAAPSRAVTWAVRGANSSVGSMSNDTWVALPNVVACGWPSSITSVALVNNVPLTVTGNAAAPHSAVAGTSGQRTVRIGAAVHLN